MGKQHGDDNGGGVISGGFAQPRFSSSNNRGRGGTEQIRTGQAEE